MLVLHTPPGASQPSTHRWARGWGAARWAGTGMGAWRWGLPDQRPRDVGGKEDARHGDTALHGARPRSGKGLPVASRAASVALPNFTKATSALGLEGHCRPQASPAQGPSHPCGLQHLVGTWLVAGAARSPCSLSPHHHPYGLPPCPHALSPSCCAALSSTTLKLRASAPPSL